MTSFDLNFKDLLFPELMKCKDGTYFGFNEDGDFLCMRLSIEYHEDGTFKRETAILHTGNYLNNEVDHLRYVRMMKRVNESIEQQEFDSELNRVWNYFHKRFSMEKTDNLNKHLAS